MPDVSRDHYRVCVRSNLVTKIHTITASESTMTEDDPLAVSTQLAQNNRTNGRLDGDYDFATFEAARYFAQLCAEFMQAACARTLDVVAKAERPQSEAWTNPVIPSTEANDT